MIESEARKESDLKQPEKRLSKKYTQAQSQLRKLCQQEFACGEDAFNAAKLLESQLPFHQLACKSRVPCGKQATILARFRFDCHLKPKSEALC